MKDIIRLGDQTTHGGTVVAASDAVFVHGIAVARQDDACTCPIAGHVSCTIVEGDPAVLDRGKPVAFDGHKTSCGATLIASISTSGKV